MQVSPTRMAELEQVLSEQVLQRLRLPDLQAIHNTCGALRALVQAAPQVVWESAAKLTGYPLPHSPPGCSWYSRVDR